MSDSDQGAPEVAPAAAGDLDAALAAVAWRNDDDPVTVYLWAHR